MSLSNGILSAPISIAEVAQCLGVSSQDLGTLCLSTAINEKSKHKPFQNTSATKMTEAQRRAANYGHAFMSYDTPGAAIAAVAAGTNFVYTRPYTWYRLLDFDGYNHNAGNWFDCTPYSSTIHQSQSITFQFDNVQSIFELGELSAYSASSPNIQFGFILSQSAFTAQTVNVYWYPCTGVQTLADLSVIRITGGKLGVGEWYAYPCLTNVSPQTYQQGNLYYIRGDSSVGGFWWPYPFCNIASFTITSSSLPVEDIAVTGETWQLTPVGSYYYTLSEMYVRVTNTGNQSHTVVLDAKIVNLVGADVSLDGATVTVAANSYTTARIQKNATQQFEVAFTDNIQCRVEYWIQGQTAQREQVTINLANEK